MVERHGQGKEGGLWTKIGISQHLYCAGSYHFSSFRTARGSPPGPGPGAGAAAQSTDNVILSPLLAPERAVPGAPRPRPSTPP